MDGWTRHVCRGTERNVGLHTTEAGTKELGHAPPGSHRDHRRLRRRNVHGTAPSRATTSPRPNVAASTGTFQLTRREKSLMPEALSSLVTWVTKAMTGMDSSCSSGYSRLSIAAKTGCCSSSLHGKPVSWEARCAGSAHGWQDQACRRGGGSAGGSHGPRHRVWKDPQPALPRQVCQPAPASPGHAQQDGHEVFVDGLNNGIGRF